MSRVVPLASVPNQSFTTTLDDVRWTVRMTTGKGVLSYDLTRSGVILLTGARAAAGEPLIPYAYLQTGNFIFLTNGGDLPSYELFNVSQFLVYLTADEIAALSPITYGEIVAATTKPEYLTTDDGFYLTTDTGALLTNE